MVRTKQKTAKKDTAPNGDAPKAQAASASETQTTASDTSSSDGASTAQRAETIPPAAETIQRNDESAPRADTSANVPPPPAAPSPRVAPLFVAMTMAKASNGSYYSPGDELPRDALTAEDADLLLAVGVIALVPEDAQP